MSEQQYQSKLAQKLYELYLEWNPKLSDTSTMGWNAILYRSSRHLLLDLFQRIDEDEKLRGKVKDFLKSLVEAASDDRTIESR